MPRPPGSPRRHSSRQLPSVSHSNSASSTSSNSGPADRSTRSAQKQASPQKSSTPHSLSSEERQQDPARSRPRRSRRQQDSVDLTSTTTKMEEPTDMDDDEIVEDEETTRCLCGNQDYPGPPVDASGRSRTQTTAATTTTATDPDAQSDEAGGLFIQCDSCKVWQHGGCVGIMDEAASPENYFCEECKPEFHQVLKSITGQKYSRYLPVVQKFNWQPKSTHRKASSSKDWEARAAKELERNLQQLSESTKRRSTMNSRAAYDEDEVLRKVLEESKVEDATNPSETGTRRGKRGRDESEDVRLDIKRQRTISIERSLSPSNGESPGVASDQDPTKKKQAPRGAAARSQREKELREKERERAEAANKRKGRAERRRAEEEEAAEAERAKAANDPVAEEGSASQPPDTPSGSAVGAPTREGPRRGPRPGGKRGRGGRGGFSHRETYTGEGSPAGGKNGKEKSVSPKDPTDGPGSGADSSATTNAPAPPTRRGRPSQNNSNGGPREPTMAELKRRAAAMLDFIAQSQIDMERTETKDLGVNGNATPSAPVAESIPPEERSPTAGLAGDLATRLAKWQQDFTGEGVSIESGGK